MNRIIKIASLLLAAVMLLSCRGQNDDDQGVEGSVLKIVADRNLIQSDGNDAAVLTVTLDGEVVTEGVTFFDGRNNVLDIADFRFTTTKAGEYKIWANYGTFNSEMISLMAVAVPIPQTPEDENPGSTDFVSRVLLAQFTGVNCGFCPVMMRKLHPVLEDEAYADKVVWVASHSYDAGDPAYLPRSVFGDILGQQYPSLNLDFRHKFENTEANTSDALRDKIDECLGAKEGKVCGIAVNAALADNQIIAKVTVKSAAEGEYRLAGLLLEDGIFGTQTSQGTDTWMSRHNSCIRYIDASNKALGHNLGTIEAGSTADYLFIWNLEDIWNEANTPQIVWKWKDTDGTSYNFFNTEKLRLAFYVTSPEADGSYAVSNAVACPVNGETPYQYAQ